MYVHFAQQTYITTMKGASVDKSTPYVYAVEYVDEENRFNVNSEVKLKFASLKSPSSATHKTLAVDTVKLDFVTAPHKGGNNSGSNNTQTSEIF